MIHELEIFELGIRPKILKSIIMWPLFLPSNADLSIFLLQNLHKSSDKISIIDCFKNNKLDSDICWYVYLGPCCINLVPKVNKIIVKGLSDYLSVRPSVRPSVCLSVCLFVCLFVRSLEHNFLNLPLRMYVSMALYAHVKLSHCFHVKFPLSPPC
jgi:hypothetical protein